MLNYAIRFFIVALIAALGFSGLAGAAAGIAKILFYSQGIQKELQFKHISPYSLRYLLAALLCHFLISLTIWFSDFGDCIVYFRQKKKIERRMLKGGFEAPFLMF